MKVKMTQAAIKVEQTRRIPTCLGTYPAYEISWQKAFEHLQPQTGYSRMQSSNHQDSHHGRTSTLNSFEPSTTVAKNRQKETKRSKLSSPTEQALQPRVEPVLARQHVLPRDLDPVSGPLSHKLTEFLGMGEYTVEKEQNTGALASMFSVICPSFCGNSLTSVS